MIKTKIGESWPGTMIMEMDGNYTHKLMLYECDESAYEYLARPISLYNWRYPAFPEDLSFFRNDKCWFWSAAHEDMGNIIPDDAKEREELRKMGVYLEQPENAPEKRYKLSEFFN